MDKHHAKKSDPEVKHHHVKAEAPVAKPVQPEPRAWDKRDEELIALCRDTLAHPGTPEALRPRYEELLRKLGV